MVGQAFNLAVSMPISQHWHASVQTPCLWLPAGADPGPWEAVVLAQLIGSLLTMWEA